MPAIKQIIISQVEAILKISGESPMKKKVLILIILLLAGLSVYYFMQIKHAKKDNGILTIYGNVDIREVDLSFRIPGLIKAMKLTG